MIMMMKTIELINHLELPNLEIRQKRVAFINSTKNKTHICENPKKLRTKKKKGEKKIMGALPTTWSGHLQKRVQDKNGLWLTGNQQRLRQWTDQPG